MLVLTRAPYEKDCEWGLEGNLIVNEARTSASSGVKILSGSAQAASS